jgi:hypothetical protein
MACPAMPARLLLLCLTDAQLAGWLAGGRNNDHCQLPRLLLFWPAGTSQHTADLADTHGTSAARHHLALVLSALAAYTSAGSAGGGDTKVPSALRSSASSASFMATGRETAQLVRTAGHTTLLRSAQDTVENATRLATGQTTARHHRPLARQRPGTCSSSSHLMRSAVAAAAGTGLLLA